MSSRFLLQLLGFWLLLSQPCRTRVSEEWMGQVIQVCGRGYARAWIEICGATMGRLALSQEEPAPLDRQAPEVVPSFIDKDAEPFDVTLKCLPNLSEERTAALSNAPASFPELQHTPALSDSVVGLEGLKTTFRDRLGEAEEDSPSAELKYFRSVPAGVSQEKATQSWDPQSLPDYHFEKAELLPRTSVFPYHSGKPYVKRLKLQKKSTNKMNTFSSLFWGNHPQRKRRGFTDKCCVKGCTKEELAVACLPYPNL